MSERAAGASDPWTPGLLARLPELPRKVALVRASRIGDFVLATPACRALRAALPDAEITLIGLPFVADLVERSPHLDRFEPFPGFPGIAEQFFDARRTTAFLERMQAERFDLAVQLHGSGVNANPFTLLLGARWTAGFVRPGDGPGRLTAALPYPQGVHEARRVLMLAEFLGAAARGLELEFPLLPEDRNAAAAFLEKTEPPLIGLHPAARDRIKRWPPERFAAVGAALQQRQGGTLVLLGGEEERATAQVIAARCGGPCLDLVGRTSLPVLGGVLARLDLLLTNDSGPAHIAYAVGTPTLTIFGGTDPAVWGPLDTRRHHLLAHPVACRPCEYADCPIGYICLDGVTADLAFEAAGKLLAR